MADYTREDIIQMFPNWTPHMQTSIYPGWCMVLNGSMEYLGNMIAFAPNTFPEQGTPVIDPEHFRLTGEQRIVGYMPAAKEPYRDMARQMPDIENEWLPKILEAAQRTGVQA